ncbi:MAG TPA: ABC transporter permease [Thermoanaerobaculia bacterium]|jgi:ABC-type antimicrobial peptide transport system permease subunit
MLSGAFRERLAGSWIEIKENLGRSTLQTLGVILGVASVLGGFSISDSQRRRSDEVWMKLGGMDRLNVQPSEAIRDGQPTALQAANLGLRNEDANEGGALDTKAVSGVMQQKFARARVRSPYADQDRQLTGIGGDYMALNGYAIEKGRAFSSEDFENGRPVAILGAEAAAVFFPTGDAVGQTIRLGDIPVAVVGTFTEKIFRWRDGQKGNQFAWRNKIVAVPSTLVARRMQGDRWQRVDRVAFRIRDLGAMKAFSEGLGAILRGNHRQQEDFRIDDVAARIRKRRSQGDVYNMIFMLSGVLSLIGGGMVNVNIQMATLKERVREVGVKMAIGASGREVFKEFMTEALLLTGLGALVGFGAGVAFSKVITSFLEIKLYMQPASFLWAFALAAAFGFLFALYPAWKASRLSPMEALRYE